MPSSVSVAEPAKLMLSPSAKVEPSAGDEIATVGVLFVTVTVIVSEPVLVSLSVADAVIVWAPADRPVVLNDPPEPILPSMLDDQLSDAVSVPSSVSVAEPAKLMLSPTPKLEPVGGDEIVTDGESLVMMTLIVSEPDNNSESVTEAVIVCVPTDKLLVLNEPPEPIPPSRFDVHAIAAVSATSSSSASVALPTKFTFDPIPKLEPVAGESMVTSGATACAAGAKKTRIRGKSPESRVESRLKFISLRPCWWLLAA